MMRKSCLSMDDHFIDCRGNTLTAVKELRKLLKQARTGHVLNIVCDENQIVRILREITDYEGMIIAQETRPDGAYITIQKT